MLARARKRKAYHELHKAELTAFLSAHPGAFDVVVSADTLCYFGDLTGFGQAAAQSLRQGGVLVFTVEALDEDAAEEHQIAHHGRYCHKESYVLRYSQLPVLKCLPATQISCEWRAANRSRAISLLP